MWLGSDYKILSLVLLFILHLFIFIKIQEQNKIKIKLSIRVFMKPYNFYKLFSYTETLFPYLLEQMQMMVCWLIFLVHIYFLHSDFAWRIGIIPHKYVDIMFALSCSIRAYKLFLWYTKSESEKLLEEKMFIRVLWAGRRKCKIFFITPMKYYFTAVVGI